MEPAASLERAKTLFDAISGWLVHVGAEDLSTSQGVTLCINFTYTNKNEKCYIYVCIRVKLYGRVLSRMHHPSLPASIPDHGG